MQCRAFSQGAFLREVNHARQAPDDFICRLLRAALKQGEGRNTKAMFGQSSMYVDDDSREQKAGFLKTGHSIYGSLTFGKPEPFT